MGIYGNHQYRHGGKGSEARRLNVCADCWVKQNDHYPQVVNLEDGDVNWVERDTPEQEAGVGPAYCEF